MKRVLSIIALAAAVAGGSVPIVHADERTIGEKVDDAAITAQVKAKLVADRAKNLVNVNVDTRDGIVHLSGIVPTEADRAEAEHLARVTKGVRLVQNDLAVRDAGAASPRTR